MDPIIREAMREISTRISKKGRRHEFHGETGHALIWNVDQRSPPPRPLDLPIARLSVFPGEFIPCCSGHPQWLA